MGLALTMSATNLEITHFRSAMRQFALFIDNEEKKPKFAEHYRACAEKNVPGIALMAEGAA